MNLRRIKALRFRTRIILSYLISSCTQYAIEYFLFGYKGDPRIPFTQPPESLLALPLMPIMALMGFLEELDIHALLSFSIFLGSFWIAWMILLPPASPGRSEVPRPPVRRQNDD